MPNHCFVPNCRSGYDSPSKTGKKCTLFRAPKDPLSLKKWQKAIPRKDRRLQPSYFVCELHFDEEDISRFFDDKKVLAREKPLLSRDAIPSKFPGCPEYLNKQKPKPLPLKRLRKTQTKRTVTSHISVSEPVATNVLSPNLVNEDSSEQTQSVNSHISTNAVTEPLDISANSVAEPVDTNPDVSSPNPVDKDFSESGGTDFSFDILKYEHFDKEPWFKTVKEKIVRYLFWPKDQCQLNKYVEIDENLNVKVIFCQVSTVFIEYEKLNNRSQFNDLLNTMEEMKICKGASQLDKFKRCSGYVQQTEDSENLTHCRPCTLYLRRISNLKKSHAVKGRRINNNVR